MSSLVAALRAEGGTVAEHLVADGPSAAPSAPARLAASGPRARGREAEYELLVDLIVEGSRLHYGTPRAVRTSDRDLSLLLGDQLYALGLGRLAALGDVVAVAELADVISMVAQAGAAGDAALVDAIWEAGAVAVGWGPSAALRAAKALVRAGDEGAIYALSVAAQAPSS